MPHDKTVMPGAPTPPRAANLPGVPHSLGAAPAEAALPETDDQKVERARRTVQAFDLLAELDRHWADPVPFHVAGRVYDDATMSLWARCRDLLVASGRAPA